MIATGATATVNDIVIFADVTGEGRADYLLLGQTGKVTGFVNRVQEKSLVPGWSQPLTIAAGPTGANKFIVAFADMTGDGKADYLLVDSKTGDVTLYENTGTGGKYQAGEGVFLCDCKFMPKTSPSCSADESLSGWRWHQRLFLVRPYGQRLWLSKYGPWHEQLATYWTDHLRRPPPRARPDGQDDHEREGGLYRAGPTDWCSPMVSEHG